MTVKYRTASSPTDREFVISSWLDASRTSYSAGLVGMSEWYPTMWPVYERIMDRPDMRTMVACDPVEHDDLFGFIVADPTEQRVPVKGRPGQFKCWPAMIVFLYIKSHYRGRGFARGLVGAVGVDVSKPFLYAGHTRITSGLVARYPQSKYDPLQIRFPKQGAA